VPVKRFNLGDLSPLKADLTLPDRATLASQLRRRRAVDIPVTPDRERGTETDIIEDNVRALAVVYAAAQLEYIKLFAVADAIAEQVAAGLVPLSQGPAGDAAEGYFKSAAERLTEAERRGLYARSFGPPLGPTSEPDANTTFSDRWCRFVTEAGGFPCESGGDERRAAARRTFESARDLAINLSPRGDAGARFAADQLQSTLQAMVTLVSRPEILKAYGARDPAVLIERVSALHLGAAISTARGWGLAVSGAAIIDWLADRAASLAPPGRALDLCGNLELLEHVRRWLGCEALNPDT
jgi:hypothetical protein